MKKWAVIENGIVVNTIYWDGESEWEPIDGQSVVEIPIPNDGSREPGISWMYSGGVFIPPPEAEETTPALEA